MHNEAVAIYKPPTDEWPYVVLVRHDNDYDAFVAKTHEEARTIAIAKSSKQRPVNDTELSQSASLADVMLTY